MAAVGLTWKAQVGLRGLGRQEERNDDDEEEEEEEERVAVDLVSVLGGMITLGVSWVLHTVAIGQSVRL